MLKILKKVLTGLIVGVLALVVILAILVYAITYHPADVQAADLVCPADAPELKPGQELKVLNWNVQYMGSKQYVFWYDVPAGDGPDLRPAPEAIEATFQEVARVIRAENPDVILLQEVNEGAANTDYVDQLAGLLERLPADYRCYSDTFYWKADFVPHPKVMGSVGMKLATISKYKIAQATRYPLPLIPADPLSQQFNLKRAALESVLPVTGATNGLVALNTHLDAFAQGDDTMQRQVNFLNDHMTALKSNGRAFFISGDFNLLPAGFPLDDLPDFARGYYNPQSELAPLFQNFTSAVPLDRLIDRNTRAPFYTFFSNNPGVTGPDRTIDHVFFAPPLTLKNYAVRSADTTAISDHLPMVFTFQLPAR